jgi:hypothetical protein
MKRLTDEELRKEQTDHVRDVTVVCCAECFHDWPCPTIRLVTEVQGLRPATQRAFEELQQRLTIYDNRRQNLISVLRAALEGEGSE